jgi:CheY-like chemotaxis protein
MSKSIIIVLIDDDEDDIDIFKDVVYNEIELPIEVITGRNGLDCLKLLEEITPDIVFLDINMPIMGGIECLKIIKNHNDYKEVPIVIYSTTTNKQEIETVKKLGAYFLSKPISFKNSIPPLQNIISKIITD